MIRITGLLISVVMASCGSILDHGSDAHKGSKTWGSRTPVFNVDSTVQVLIEITSGTTAKWELNKSTNRIEQDTVLGRPRHVDYLGYPANYGMIPNTLMSTRDGGDGDPVDVIVLGEALPRGTISRCRVIGVLRLRDHGETDDKIIAVSVDNGFGNIMSIAELDTRYPALLEILELWFTNYKGSGRVSSHGYGGKEEALELIARAEVDRAH